MTFSLSPCLLPSTLSVIFPSFPSHAVYSSTLYIIVHIQSGICPRTHVCTCTCTIYLKKNATLIKFGCATFQKKTRAALLWFASGFVWEAYCTACSWEKRHILGLRRFTRRRTYRDSVKVLRTQRDKHGAQYAALISAAPARLLHFLNVYRIICTTMHPHTRTPLHTHKYTHTRTHPHPPWSSSRSLIILLTEWHPFSSILILLFLLRGRYPPT